MPKLRLIIASLFLYLNIQAQDLVQPDSGYVEPSGFNFSLKEPKKYIIGDISVSGTQYLDKSAILSLVGLKPGDPISIPGDQITMAIRKLWAQGILGNIEFSVTKIEGEKVFINIDLQERQRLAKFTFSGIPKEQADDVREKIRLIKGKVVTEPLLKNAQNQIKKFYFEKGFLNATVKATRSVDTATPNYVSINFHVKKGKRVKIKDINFIGLTKFPAAVLREKMKGTKKRVWWMVWQTSKFIQSKFEEDKKSLVDFYNSEGYRDMQIVRDSVVHLNKKRIRLDIQLEEGNKYYFRNVTWKGNYLYDNKYLDNILGVKKGDVYNFQSLEKKLNYNPTGQDISSLYLDDGYLFFSIDPVETKVDGDSIDVEMRMYEGPQATIDKVTIAGNTKTSDHVVLREIRTRPGKKFSRADLIRSQRELSQLGYFDPEKINIQPIPNPEKGTVAINYELVEKPSDQIQLSGGWGGYTGFVGTLGLVFNNFSARNIFKFKEYNPLPSGDGQRLSLNVQANGPSYQSYSISFAEPWLGGKRPITFSISASHSIQRLGIPGVFGQGLGSSIYNYNPNASGSLK
ncbi:MAG: outer membrane protein assembly factor BamA, partial [Cytophagales bacterium]|nr:outer membrane protein assembly factor BamA [Cytophagales bacterium]